MEMLDGHIGENECSLIKSCSRFLIEDGAKANYAAISANVALAGIEGGHDKYDLYLR